MSADIAPELPPSPLAGKHVLLALSGGIACYKSAELVRRLVQAGASVQVMMSEAAQAFITPTTMQALSGRPVFTSQWEAGQPNAMPHINASREADCMLVAPASADLIARLAAGLADEIVSLTALARPRGRCPLLLAPAMNREMWQHPATQRNLAQVVADGAQLLGVGHGEQACGEVGDGRMLEADALAEALAQFLAPKPLAGRRLLLTAGPTFEAIDPVRGITNLSSGKMGFAIARAAREAGAQVTLVAGPVSLPTPQGVRRHDVRSARAMHAAVMAEAPGHDLFIATAAVADWRPVREADEKIKKDGSGQVPTIAFTENPDILAEVARLPGGPWCVGFAAESHDLLRHAREKRRRKGVPWIVANLGPQTFGRDDNTVWLVGEHEESLLGSGDKLALARALVAALAQRMPPPAAAKAAEGAVAATRGMRGGPQAAVAEATAEGAMEDAVAGAVEAGDSLARGPA